MNPDIIGEWAVTLVEKGKETHAGRIVFAARDGRIWVTDADPDNAGRPARVDVDGETLRFEFLSAGSSRGNAHHNFELQLQGADVFAGTRRRGMLAKTFVTGQRVASGALALPAGSADAGAPDTAYDTLAAAKARAAEAAERASLAAAEAAAALAEAEAVAALEGARRAAERAAAARAAATPAAPVRIPVAPEVLATLPAPTDPPAFVPLAPVQAGQAPEREVEFAGHEAEHDAGHDAAHEAGVASPPPHAPGRRLLGITHRLTHGDSAVLAAEVFPSVFVWGGTFAAPEQRLREAGWEIVAVETGETIEVDGLLIQHAAMIRDSVSS